MAYAYNKTKQEWYEILWDAVKEVFLQIVYILIDGVVYKIKKELQKRILYG